MNGFMRKYEQSYFHVSYTYKILIKYSRSSKLKIRCPFSKDTASEWVN